MNRGKSPQSHNTDSGLDKLSNLPSCVIEQILSLLPIKDAVRTSVLASQWRFKWATMSDLVFDQSAMIRNDPVNFIDHALLLHTGTISKFELAQTSVIYERADLDRWILRLSRCNVQKFILKILGWQGPAYKLHSSLFSFQDLVHLDLHFCCLKLPSTFAGFKKLKSLKIHTLYTAQDAFETLISSCPMLECLTILYFYGFNHLNIDAPNLLKIKLLGCFDDMNLINCSKLEEVSIELCVTGDATETVKARDSSNLLKFFSCLPHINWLKIEGEFLKYLAGGDIPRQLPNPCTDLGYLWLEILNDDYVECSISLCLLRSSPNLQELHIRVWESPVGNELTFWKSKHTNCSFNKLRSVNIYVCAVKKNKLDLIGFVLLASPVLQKMTISAVRPASEKQAMQFARRLMRLKRASPNAKVSFKL